MQYYHFRTFVRSVLAEGNRLQRHDIDGKPTTKYKYTNLRVIAFCLSVVVVIILPKGYPENFAGFVIGFLGIFIGLFATAVISSFDRRETILRRDLDADQASEDARLELIKNHLIQFTGLTSYSILLASILVILLAMVLIHEVFRINIYDYQMVSSLNQAGIKEILNIIKVSFLVAHRYFITYLLIQFFIITIYSLTSYFSYLQSEYRRIKLK